MHAIRLSFCPFLLSAECCILFFVEKGNYLASFSSIYGKEAQQSSRRQFIHLIAPWDLLHIKMRKVLAIIAVMIALMIIPNIGLCDQEAKYTAQTSTEFHLRAAPDGRHLAVVPKGRQVEIIEWAEDWCLANYQGTTGYCKTSWLYCLRSLDPFQYPLPENPCEVSGYLVLLRDTVIQAGKFDGTHVIAGDPLCASPCDDGYVLPVWRDKQVLSADAAEYHPFVPWEAAQKGDIISGFTTYYSDKQGKNRPKEREHNILLGCERINNLLLQSGENFSFNALCAPYTKSNGYQLAPNISKSGDGYGGGICQVSTTLYNALLMLPIQFDEWNIHRYKGIDYVPQFFDAAVGLYPDFAFTNTLPYPIRICVSADHGVLSLFILCEQ